MTVAPPDNQLRLVQARRALTVAAYCALATGLLAFALWSSNAFEPFSWDAREQAIRWAFIAIVWAPGVGGLLGLAALFIAFRTRVGRIPAAAPVLIATLYYVASYSFFSHLPVH